MTHKQRTFDLLRNGWITALECAQKGGCLALSQRVGEFRREGIHVSDKWVKAPSGARVKAYKIIKPTRWTA